MSIRQALNDRIHVLRQARPAASLIQVAWLYAMPFFRLSDVKNMLFLISTTVRWIALVFFWGLLGSSVMAQPSALGANYMQFGAFKFNPYAQLDYQINGQTRGLNYNAQAQITWKATGQNYNAKFDIKMPLFFGTRTQISEGLLSEQGLKPVTFSDRHRKSQTVSIDQTAGQIRLADGNTSLPLEKLHQDALSVFFQLGGLLAGLNEPYPFSSTLRLPVLMAQTNEHWTFKLETLDNLKLPMGEVAALKVLRLPRSPTDKQKLTLWLSPNLGFLPVRILIEEENQDLVDQRLLAFKSSP